MSWSVSAVGRPEEVVGMLDGYGATLSGQSKLEFDEARPHLIGLVRQNFSNPRPGESAAAPLRVSLTAYGSGYAAGDRQVSRSCSVRLETAPAG